MSARLSPRSMPRGNDVAICVFQLCSVNRDFKIRDATAVRRGRKLIFKEVTYCTCSRHRPDGLNRAEKRKWLRHCPVASNVGSSARSFEMIEIIAGKKTPVFKVKK